MPTFSYAFTVDATAEIVRDFHHDPSVLKTLTPPPLIAQIHSFEPLAEGSQARFTLWFGPFPIHWMAIHSDVTDSGFTDIQIRGPLKVWQHQHTFTAVDDSQTLVSERIYYEYKKGMPGLLSRLFFSPPALYLLFTGRKLITRNRIAAIKDTQRDYA